LALSLPQLAHAHGLNLSLTDGNDAITGNVTYADGAPLSGASIALQRTANDSAAPMQRDATPSPLRDTPANIE